MDHDTIAADIRAAIAALPRQNTPSIRALRKEVSRTLRGAADADVIELAHALDRTSPQPTKWVAYELLRFHRPAFAAVAQTDVEALAERVASWYATDAFGTILAGPLWAEGRLEDHLVERWSRSENRWLRRLALVTTVGRNARRPDAERTFVVCLTLADDRDDMVVKAVSWALRYLSQKDHAAVAAFMAEHGQRFAARVRREVATKLTTGRKR